jgi:hypothetical protein
MKNASGKRPSKLNRKLGTTTTPTNAHQCMKVYYIIHTVYLLHVSATSGVNLGAFVAFDIIHSCPMYGHGSFEINGTHFLVLHPHLLYPSYTFSIFMSLPNFFLKANTATLHTGVLISS